MYEYRAKLLRVVDADTLDIRVDLGLHIHHDLRVRLIDVDAPERFTPEGKAATAFALEYIGDDALIVNTVRDKTEKYGRYLAYVRPENRVVTLNGALVAHGHVKHEA